MGGLYRAHVPGVRRTGVLGAGEQAAVAVLHPTGVREPCDVGPRARTRIRNRVQRAAPTVVRNCVGVPVADRTGRRPRVLLPDFRTLPGLVRWRRWGWAWWRSATASAGPAPRRGSAPGRRPVASSQARSQPAEPARGRPQATGGRSRAAPRTRRPGPPVASRSARLGPIGGSCSSASSSNCGTAARRAANSLPNLVLGRREVVSIFL